VRSTGGALWAGAPPEAAGRWTVGAGTVGGDLHGVFLEVAANLVANR
jgi:hypothetical protein